MFYIIVKTIVKKYQKTDKEIFLRNGLDLAYVDKNEDVEQKFGSTVSRAKVKNIDESEAPNSVTIYF